MDCNKQCGIKGHEKVPPVLVETPDLKHYGRWNCGICGKFIVWAKTPKANQEMLDRQETILSIIRENPGMPKVDLHKLCTVYGEATLCYKYKTYWADLSAKYIDDTKEVKDTSNDH